MRYKINVFFFFPFELNPGASVKFTLFKALIRELTVHKDKTTLKEVSRDSEKTSFVYMKQKNFN